MIGALDRSRSVRAATARGHARRRPTAARDRADAGAAQAVVAWLARETADRPPLERADSVTLDSARHVDAESSGDRSPSSRRRRRVHARAADRVRERGEHDARARHGAAARNRHSPRARRRPRTAHPATAHRSDVARCRPASLGFLVSRAAIALSLARHVRDGAARRTPTICASFRSTPTRASSRSCSASAVARGGRVRSRAGAAGDAAEHRAGVARRLRHAVPSVAAAQRARRGADRVSVLLLICAGVLLSATRGDTRAARPGIRTRNVVQIELSLAQSTRACSTHCGREPIVRGDRDVELDAARRRFSEVALIAHGSRRSGRATTSSRRNISPCSTCRSSAGAHSPRTKRARARRS